jgi:hypothetical protein
VAIHTQQGRTVEIIKPPRFDRGMIHVQVAVNGVARASVGTVADVFETMLKNLPENEFWDWIAYSAEAGDDALKDQQRKGLLERVEL